MRTNFLLGTLRITKSARLALKRQPYDLVARHAINEHGNITQVERSRNEVGMKTLGPIISRYRADPTDPSSKVVVVLTMATWSETIVSVEVA
jgi:hypothetical protein